jgi:hypothetical protein
MNSENHNNTTWRIKLDDLESLPGEPGADKNALWTKLDAQLRRKRNTRKPIWYWSAAACILFVFMIQLMISNKGNHQLVNTDVNQNQPEAKQIQSEKPASAVTMNHKKDSIKIKNPVPSEKNVVIISDKKTQENIQKNRKDKLRVSDTVSTQNQIAETTDNSLQIIDSSFGFASAIPAKKKLPVVHINELGDPADVSPQMARNSEKTSVHFLKLGSQEVYNNPSVSITKSFATVNFKTSPN